MKTTSKLSLLLTTVISLPLTSGFLTSCSKEKNTSSDTDTQTESSTSSAQPAGEEGAKAILNAILSSPDKAAELSKQLQPTTADYATVFSDAAFAKKAEATYGGAWDSGAIVVKPKPGQTELKLFSATSDDLKAWNDKARPFPGGYKRVANQFNNGITIYCFKFLKPGEQYGMAYNGLIHVNGHWRLFPKPWRIAP